METCGSSHYWARELTKLGQDVRLIPDNYVKPYVKRGKSDANDAEAICEAVTRPTMRFVAPKSEEQQAVLFLHRARDLIVRQRTQLSNMLRSLFAEFGVIIPQGTGAAVKYATGVLEGEKPALPQIAIDVLRQLSHQLVAMHLRFRWYEMRMRLHSKLDKRVMLLRTIPGVGDRRNGEQDRPDSLGSANQERIISGSHSSKSSRNTRDSNTIEMMTRSQPANQDNPSNAQNTVLFDKSFGPWSRKPSEPVATSAAQTGRTHVCF